MSRHVPFVLLFAVAALTACKPSTPEAAPLAGSNADAQTAAAEAAPAEVLPEGLKAGMAFSEARAALAAAGWLPLRDRGACMTQVGDRSALCSNTPELASCGQQSCTLDFANADALQRLSLVVDAPAASDSEDVPVFGAVKSWVVSAVAAAKATAACPAADFDGFLKAFASDDRIERAFTAPLVKVAELYSDDAGDHARMVYMTGAGYDGFNVNHAGNAFHFVDSEGKVDTSPLALEVSQTSDSIRTVRYRYGMSEGNSYRFENMGGCWYLSEDPEAPSP